MSTPAINPSFSKRRALESNIAAIRTMFKVEQENRPPTAEEKVLLEGFVGFGALKFIGKGYEEADLVKYTQEEKPLRGLVQELFDTLRSNTSSEEEFKALSDSIMQSSLTAFYTPQPVADAIVTALLGKVGASNVRRVLDPSAGTGAFTRKIAELTDAQIVSIEKEVLTARILSAIHKGDERHIVYNCGYEDLTPQQLGKFDLVISNSPFGDVSITDKHYVGLPQSDPYKAGYTKYTTSNIHNFFIYKSLDVVREGGLVSFITGRGFMDTPNQGNTFRRFLVEEGGATPVSALRFPDGLFSVSGTPAGSDFIVLQKTPSKDYANVVENEFIRTEKIDKHYVRNVLFGSDHHYSDFSALVGTTSKQGKDNYGKPAFEYPMNENIKGNLSAFVTILEQSLSEKMLFNYRLYRQIKEQPHTTEVTPAPSLSVETKSEIPEHIATANLVSDASFIHDQLPLMDYTRRLSAHQLQKGDLVVFSFSGGDTLAIFEEENGGRFQLVLDRDDTGEAELVVIKADKIKYGYSPTQSIVEETSITAEQVSSSVYQIENNDAVSLDRMVSNKIAEPTDPQAVVEQQPVKPLPKKKTKVQVQSGMLDLFSDAYQELITEPVVSVEPATPSPTITIAEINSPSPAIPPFVTGKGAYNVMPAALAKKVPQLYATETIPVLQKVAYARYFHPFTSYTTYLLEYDPATRLGFCLTSFDGERWELGDVSLEELSQTVVGGLKIERDLYFKESPLAQIEELQEYLTKHWGLKTEEKTQQVEQSVPAQQIAEVISYPFEDGLSVKLVRELYEEKKLFVNKKGEIGRISEYDDYGRPLFTPLLLSQEEQEKAAALVKLRNDFNALYNHEASIKSPDNMLRSVLNEQYRLVLHQWDIESLNGSKTVQKFIKNVLELDELMYLEREENGTWVKADIFHQPVVSMEEDDAITVYTPQEALIASLNNKGKFDLPYIETLLPQIARQEIIEALQERIIYNPLDSNYELREFFLSGNVVQKLDSLLAWKEANPDHLQIEEAEQSILALQAVQPEKLDIIEEINLGERWIPTKVYTRFVSELFKNYRVTVDYDPKADRFQISDAYNHNRLHLAEPYTLKGSAQTYNGYDLLLHAMHDLVPTITKKIRLADGTEAKVPDREKMFEFQEKTNNLKEEFRSWLLRHPDICTELNDRYHRVYNSYVKTQYDGTHQTFPDLNFNNLGFTDLYNSQKNAIWMLLSNGGGIIDHEVGGGKTMIMCAGAYEMKRLGLAQKPLIIGLKANVKDIADTYKKAYPSARLLFPTEKDFQPAGREKFFHLMKNNQWDCIIMSHEQFGMIPSSLEMNEKIIREELMMIEKNLLLSKENSVKHIDNRALKGLEKAKTNKEAQLREVLASLEQREQTGFIDFKALGIDHIFIDESHQFKNLGYSTRHHNISGLGTKEGSQRALKLLSAIRVIQERTGKDLGATFLSGTTVSNSIVELYSIYRYLRPHALEEKGLSNLDAWLSMYAKKVYDYESNVVGNVVYKERFSSFAKVPELGAFYAEITDFQTADTIGLERPEIADPDEFIEIEPSPQQTEYMRRILEFAKTGSVEKSGIIHDDPDRAEAGVMLVATDQAVKASLDMRLIDPSFGDSPFNKSSRSAEEIAKIYTQFNEQKGVQLVFCDLSTPKKDGSFSIYTDIKEKLVELYGIPENEIAFIQDYDTQKQRTALFKKVNAGEVRVLMGSTQKLGTGVNVQERVVAIHHLDAPWRPSDLEQRDGRAIRKGNWVARDFNDNKVRRIPYGTKKTVDAYKFGVLNSKQTFIRQLKTNSLGGRVLDEGAMDANNGSLPFAILHAQLSGSDALLRKVQLEKEIAAIKSKRKVFLQTRSAAEVGIISKKVELDILQRHIEGSRKDLESVQSLFTGDSKVLPFYIEGVPANATLEEKVKQLQLMGDTYDTGQNYVPVGKIGNFPIVLRTIMLENGVRSLVHHNRVFIQGEGGVFYSHNNGLIAKDPETVQKGLSSAIMPEKVEELIKGLEAKVEPLQLQIEQYQAILEKQWSDNGELSVLEGKLKAVLQELEEDARKPFKGQDINEDSTSQREVTSSKETAWEIKLLTEKIREEEGHNTLLLYRSSNGSYAIYGNLASQLPQFLKEIPHWYPCYDEKYNTKVPAVFLNEEYLQENLRILQEKGYTFKIKEEGKPEIKDFLLPEEKKVLKIAEPLGEPSFPIPFYQYSSYDEWIKDTFSEKALSIAPPFGEEREVREYLRERAPKLLAPYEMGYVECHVKRKEDGIYQTQFVPSLESNDRGMEDFRRDWQERKEEYMAMREAEHANKSVLLSTKLTQEVLPKEVAAEHNTWTAYTEFTHPLHPEYHCYICAYHEERNSVSAMTVKNQKTFFGEIPLSKFDVNISGYSFERNVDFQTTSVKELIDMHQQHNVQTVKVEQTSTPKTTELNAVTYTGHTTDSSTKEFLDRMVNDNYYGNSTLLRQWEEEYQSFTNRIEKEIKQENSFRERYNSLMKNEFTNNKDELTKENIRKELDTDNKLDLYMDVEKALGSKRYKELQKEISNSQLGRVQQQLSVENLLNNNGNFEYGNPVYDFGYFGFSLKPNGKKYDLVVKTKFHDGQRYNPYYTQKYDSITAKEAERIMEEESRRMLSIGNVVVPLSRMIDELDVNQKEGVTQIKSATDNIGTFDNKNPDIRYQEGTQYEKISTAESEALVSLLETTGLSNGVRMESEEEMWRGLKEVQGVRMSDENNVTPREEREYAQTVERGDIERAQELLQIVADRRGYSSNTDYQGISAFNGAAPSSSVYYDSLPERIEAWENGDYEGDWSLSDELIHGIGMGDLEHRISANEHRRADTLRKEAIQNLRNVRTAVQSGKKNVTIKVYRSVPTDVVENNLRNGDWVTPSRLYAIDNADVHKGYPGWENGYRIIEQEIPIEHLWWDGNDIAEWGYDNGKQEAYKNTPNNRKEFSITYDDQGNLIPLSKRFDSKKADTRYMRLPNGVIYGYVDARGVVHLNKDRMNRNTPIHEFGHLWNDFAKQNYPELYARGEELIKETPYWGRAPSRSWHCG